MQQFANFFAVVPDPRAANARHEFMDILFIAIAAVLCGARTLGEIREDVEGVRSMRLTPARYGEILRFGDALHASGRRSARFMFRQG